MWSIDAAGDAAGDAAVAAADDAGTAHPRTATRLPRIESRAGGITRFSDVFVLADRTIAVSVVATSDVYVSAPME
jgi:hypothetical protein